RAETIVVAPRDQLVWAETDLTSDVYELIQELDKKRELGKKISDKPLSLAVAVSESVSGGSGPHAFMQSEQKPRLVVFGDATLVSNALMSDRGSGSRYYDLFASCLAWLRERPSNIGIEPKKDDLFVLNPATNVWQMIWVPGVLMLIGII